jgi:hypothetical protein
VYDNVIQKAFWKRSQLNHSLLLGSKYRNSQPLAKQPQFTADISGDNQVVVAETLIQELPTVGIDPHLGRQVRGLFAANEIS